MKDFFDIYLDETIEEDSTGGKEIKADSDEKPAKVIIETDDDQEETKEGSNENGNS